MFLEPAVINEFTVGAASGIGGSLGARLIDWLACCWTRWTRKKSTPELPLLRKVQLKDLAGTIPSGMLLCRYRDDQFLDSTNETVPDHVATGESLWLIPQGSIWLNTELASGADVAEADVAVEFDPELGLHHLLQNGADVQRGLLSGLVSGGFLGILNSPGWGGWSQLLAGEPTATAKCLSQVNGALSKRGIRCIALRNIEPSTYSISDKGMQSINADRNSLVQEISQVRTAQDWQKLTQGLEQSGVPVDRQAEHELRAMQVEVLNRQLPPEQAANRLAALTAESLERAGISIQDLSRWQSTAAKLVDQEAQAPTSTSPASSGVAKVRRPGTWWVWSRPEVDRRLLRFLQRSSQRCRVGLDQALLTVSDLPSLRKLRDLQSQVTLLDELLGTMPVAEPRTRGLRLDGQQVKEAVTALETAVTQAESLSASVDTLLRLPTDNPQWQETWGECSQSTTILIQHVRDRRTVR